MSLDDQRLIRFLTSRTDLDASKAYSDSFVSQSLYLTLRDTRSKMKNQTLRTSITFSLWNHLYNDYGIHGDKREQTKKPVCGKNYSRGRLLLIDFGHHNIGREFSYPHIGIVLANYYRMLIVAPVTSDEGKTYPPDIEKSIVHARCSEYSQFRKDSLILAHQIRVIDKNRVINDLHQTIAKTDLMKDVEEILMNTLSPYQSNEYQRRLEEKEQEVEDLREVVAQLQERVSFLQQAAPTSE
jgi:mRNA-degrading endonuclease toxin of MazEF toxin-antitoxin module